MCHGAEVPQGRTLVVDFATQSGTLSAPTTPHQPGIHPGSKHPAASGFTASRISRGISVLLLRAHCPRVTTKRCSQRIGPGHAGWRCECLFCEQIQDSVRGRQLDPPRDLIERFKGLNVHATMSVSIDCVKHRVCCVPVSTTCPITAQFTPRVPANNAQLLRHSTPSGSTRLELEPFGNHGSTPVSVLQCKHNRMHA